MIYLIKGILAGILLVILLLLQGCGGGAIVVDEIKVPVAVSCKVNVPTRPVMPLEQAKKDESDIFVIVQKALAEIEIRQGYEIKLEAAIMECNK